MCQVSIYHHFLGATTTKLRITSCHPLHHHVLLSPSHIHQSNWRGKQAWSTADGHAILLFTGHWPMTALCVRLCVCGDELSLQTYSPCHFLTSVPLRSGDHTVIISTVAWAKILLVCPIPFGLAWVIEGNLSCFFKSEATGPAVPFSIACDHILFHSSHVQIRDCSEPNILKIWFWLP